MVHQGNGVSSLIQVTLESLGGGGPVGIEYMLEADSGKGKSCKCTKWKLTPLPHSMAPVKTAKAYYFWHHKGGGELNVVFVLVCECV